jgi:hypothetical protein
MYRDEEKDVKNFRGGEDRERERDGASDTMGCAGDIMTYPTIAKKKGQAQSGQIAPQIKP